MNLPAVGPAPRPNTENLVLPAPKASHDGTGMESGPDRALEFVPATRQELDQVVSKMNQVLAINVSHLKFEISDSNRIVISVIDSNTGEILKQIPPEELVQTSRRMDEYLGMLVDRKV